MKRICIFALFSMICFSIQAQDWIHEIPSDKPDFYEIQAAFENYYGRAFYDPSADSEWKKFKRLEAFMEPRVYPTGKFDPEAAFKACREQDLQMQKTGSTSSGNWSTLGPINPGWGRVNCIVIDPNNSSTYWCGTPGGGIFKSTDAGSSWTEKTGSLPTISIANIVVEPGNADHIFVATGDHYGYAPAGWPWFAGGTYSMGILESTDGGNTWNPTGMSYELADNIILRRLLMDPNNTSILLAAANDGIWRSTDAGATWSRRKGGNIYDMEFNAANSSLVYAVSDSVFKSTDGGVTWNWVSTAPVFPQNTFYRRVSVAVTPADPNYIYVMNSELNSVGNIYLSTDGGTNWNATVPSGVNFLGYWDNVISISPTNKQHIFCGGQDAEYTTDGGATWNSSFNYGYVDQHDAVYLPGGNEILLANDGGLFKSNFSSLTNLSYGLQMTQFYAMGASATDAGIIYGGVQDRGTLRMLGNSWDRVLPNDGAEAIVDYTDPNIVYGSWQYGNFRKSTDGGNNWSIISPGSGSWTAPMVMHPTNPNILFYGGAEVGKSTDGGQTWNDISTSVIPGQCISLAVAESNPDYIYAATYYQIYRTTDGGTSWNNITGTLPWQAAAISYIAISGANPDHVWVSLSGYTPGEKVYKTTDGGATWVNYSGGLPNVPVNCVTFDNSNSDNSVYIGTDIGVYQRDDLSTDWNYFNSGLPRVIVHELEIHYGSGMIRAATHGRGMWESPLTVPVREIPEREAALTFSLFPNPSQGLIMADLGIPDGTSGTLSVLDAYGKQVHTQPTPPREFSRVTLDLTHLPAGMYWAIFNWKGERISRPFQVIK